jgi:hypothetical protein
MIVHRAKTEPFPLLDEAGNADLAVKYLNASFEDSSAQGAGYFFG